MRADTLRSITGSSGMQWTTVDTDKGFAKAPRLLKSSAFRFRSGPLVRQINRNVVEQSRTGPYDLVWVDKGVYLWRDTVKNLRMNARQLVHFTPDTAFHANRSRHFRAAASQYDLLVTTKSFEVEEYSEISGADRIYLTTQAFDETLHRPVEVVKKPVATFIGLCEPDRENCIQALLDSDIRVRLGGRGWEQFIARHASNPALHYLGGNVFGADYVAEYSSASIGLGLLSKRFPELHTTRTFEIPACGTLLATERTADTREFYEEDEVLFFHDYDDLAQKLSVLLQNPEKIEATALRGQQRVNADGRDYKTVLSGILNRLSIP